MSRTSYWARVKAPAIRCSFGHTVDRGTHGRFGVVVYGRRAFTCADCMRTHYKMAPPQLQAPKSRDGKLLAYGDD